MVLRIVGKTFIGTGVLILLFLGYQLFGTNVVTKQAQKALAEDLEQSFEDQPTIVGAAPVEPAPADVGQGIARIQIPKINIDWVVVEGVGVEALKRGPGHYPGTKLPGERGNVVISGHRTTYGAPFFRLDELTGGDVIRVVTVSGTHFYRVRESKIVAPTDLSVVVSTEDSRLTLTTCHPRFSAAKRLIVVADLIETKPERVA